MSEGAIMSNGATPKTASPAFRQTAFGMLRAWSLHGSGKFVIDLLRPILFISGLLVVWEIVVRGLAIPSYVLPAPSAIAEVITTRFGPLMQFAQITARSTLLGFGFGVTIGLFLGVGLGSSRKLYDMAFPSVIAFHAIPSVALIPLFIIWFGVGSHISVIVAVMSAFFPVAVMVSTAIAASSPELDDVLRSLGSRKIDILIKVAIPRAMPQFFGSIKLAITAAFIGTVVAEIYAGSPGIGRIMIIASNDLNGPLAFSGLALLSVMGVTLYSASRLLEKRLTGWTRREN